MAPTSSSAALLSYGRNSASASARVRRRFGTSIGCASTPSSLTRSPTGGSRSASTAVMSSLRQGPASDGATISAIDVTSMPGTAWVSWRAIVSSKSVTSSGTSSSTKRTMSASRSTIGSSEPTTTTLPIPPSSSAARISRSVGAFKR